MMNLATIKVLPAQPRHDAENSFAVNRLPVVARLNRSGATPGSSAARTGSSNSRPGGSDTRRSFPDNRPSFANARRNRPDTRPSSPDIHRQPALADGGQTGDTPIQSRVLPRQKRAWPAQRCRPRDGQAVNRARQTLRPMAWRSLARKFLWPKAFAGNKDETVKQDRP